MFSSRLPASLARNALAVAVERLRAAGRPFADLTESNPTRARIDYPAGLLDPLAQPAALRYDPHPLGIPEARAAVASDFERRGTRVAAGRVVVTASTSEAYSALFKLLCDPGDAVLAPRPSYPLVEHIARLDGVVTEFYDLEYDGAWSVDVDGLARAVASPDRTARPRAIVVVSPNNPTGSRVTALDLEAIGALCRAHQLALIADEVFADYSLEDGGEPGTSVLEHPDGLTFALGGLSKTVGLPQVKLGWCGVAGPDHLVRQALEHLEVISDTYLSVSTPVQLAAASLLQRGAAVRARILARVRDNDRVLRRAAAAHPACRVLPAEAGWSAIVRVPSVRSEDTLVLDLLERAGVLVHPGYFFDFPAGTHVVLSLLPPTDVFAPAVERMLREVSSSA